MRPTSCVIDLRAIAHNVRTLAAMAAPAELCAVVKADAYGHGAIPVARVALEAGATWLAVALVEEGVALRSAGIDQPILLLSEPHESSMREVVEHRLTPSLYTPSSIAALATVADPTNPTLVQLVVDTGMRRVGAEPEVLDDLVALVRDASGLELGGVWTHFPVADEPQNPFNDLQLQRFDREVEKLPAGTMTHWANSAGTITRRHAAGTMVRCGIAIYGIDPDAALAGMVPLRPALTLRSAVSFVKPIRAGEGVGYGLRWTASVDTTIATVPVGYADGVRRDLGLRGGAVLIGGRRHPIVGVVTMDQLMVDVGAEVIAIGDEVVLIGSQRDSTITAADIAATLDSIPYEVVCAIGPRVPRTYPTGLGEPLSGSATENE